ncbi:MAG: amidohydrolase family protein [Candidatus Bathycorpusculaceae bacterium]
MEKKREEVTCIKAGLLIDGTGREPLTNPIVVVKGDKIAEVGKETEIKAPEEAKIVDLGNLTILPGLVDAHVHIYGRRSYSPAEEIITPHDLAVIRAVEDCRKILKAGFTMVRDLGSAIALSLKRAINEGTISGPRIFAAGRPISQTGGHSDIHYLPREEVIKKGALIADGPDDCRRAAREVLRDGADLIKIMTSGGIGSEKDHPRHPQFTVDEVKAITEEAHRTGRRVASHAEGEEGVKIAVLGGVDSVEHGFFLDEESVQMMLNRNVYFVPTLCLVEVYKKALERPYDMPSWRLKKQEECIDAMPKSFMMAYKAGVKIAAGTDYFGPPLRAHGDNADEAITMVKYGMKPLDAILAATRNAAECIGVQGTVGTVERGKLADIIGVQGNPLEDITVLRKVEFVMKEGKTYLSRQSTI